MADSMETGDLTVTRQEPSCPSFCEALPFSSAYWRTCHLTATICQCLSEVLQAPVVCASSSRPSLKTFQAGNSAFLIYVLSADQAEVQTEGYCLYMLPLEGEIFGRRLMSQELQVTSCPAWPWLCFVCGVWS